MSTIVTRRVTDLRPQDRESLEEILGTRLESNQRIFIIVDAFYPSAGKQRETLTKASLR